MRDNLDFWAEYDERQSRKLEKLPVCSECEEPIQDEYCYDLGDGPICPECFNSLYRKPTDRYID